MSQYTTQLRYILENPMWTDERLGLANYPIFDENYRSTLNQKIKDFYYFEEIGYETPARFCFKLRQKMNLIMPYYNKLYQSELLKIEPFLNISTENELIEKVVSALKELSNKKTDITKNITSTSEKSDTGKATAIENVTNNDTSEVTSKNELSVNSNSETLLNNSVKESGDTVTTYNSKTVDTRDLSVEDKNTIEKNNSNMGENSKSYDNYSEQVISNASENNDDTQKEVTSDTPNGLLDNFNMDSFKYADSAKINSVDNKKKIEENSDKSITGKIIDTNNSVLAENSTTNNTHTETGTVTTDKSGHDDVSIKNHITDSTSKEEKSEVNSSVTDFNENTNENFTGNKETTSNTLNNINSNDKIDEINNLIDEILRSLDNNTDKNSINKQKGFTGVTMSKMLIEFRESFINIDMMIIEELKDLFMLVMS